MGLLEFTRVRESPPSVCPITSIQGLHLKQQERKFSPELTSGREGAGFSVGRGARP